jgi:hypothetical protein
VVKATLPQPLGLATGGTRNHIASISLHDKVSTAMPRRARH